MVVFLGLSGVIQGVEHATRRANLVSGGRVDRLDGVGRAPGVEAADQHRRVEAEGL